MSELERALRALAADIEWPDEYQIAPAVVERLDGAAAGAHTPVRWLVAAVLIIVVGAAAAIAPVRERVADAFSLVGITIREVVAPSPEAGHDLNLGERITAEEVASRTEAGPLVLDVGRPPDAIYVDDAVPGGMASFVWGPDQRFPEVGGTGVGLISSHFAGDGVNFVKSVSSSTETVTVTVNGVRGLWISGAPHEIFMELEPGVIVEDTLRLAANVLVWTDGATTHRVETGADLETVLSVIPDPAP